MSPQEQVDLVTRHYALQSAGNHAAAEELLTDDFVLTISPSMPFGGVFRGKQAFRTLISLVVGTVAVTSMRFVATTVGDGYVAEIVEFTLAGDDTPVQVVEVNSFRGDQICEIRPFYTDPAPWIAAADRQKAGTSSSE